jgi:hypothetical protein
MQTQTRITAIQKAIKKDPKISLFTNFNQGFVAVDLLYRDILAKRPTAFAPFYNLKSLMIVVVPSTDGTLLSLA